jgi:hypothetical protein
MDFRPAVGLSIAVPVRPSILVRILHDMRGASTAVRRLATTVVNALTPQTMCRGRTLHQYPARNCDRQSHDHSPKETPLHRRVLQDACAFVAPAGVPFVAANRRQQTSWPSQTTQNRHGASMAKRQAGLHLTASWVCTQGTKALTKTKSFPII